MLESCLFILLWTADQTIAGNSNTSTSTLTCSRPAALVFEVEPVCAGVVQKLVPPSTSSLLQRWELNTKRRPDLNRSEREEFQRRIRQEFNEHTVVAAEQFIGRINANLLEQAFDWKIVEVRPERLLLEASPHDELERLFVGSFRVTLNVQSGLPTELVVFGRDRQHRMAWQSIRPDETSKLKLVHFEGSIPPAPIVVLNNVNVRVE